MTVTSRALQLFVVEAREFSAAATKLSGLMGVLFHWTPEQFWQATPQEVEALFAALAEVRGEGVDVVAPPDAERMAALKARFPD